MVLEAADRLLPKKDEDIAKVATDILTGDGITIITQAMVTRVEDVDGGTQISYTKDGDTDTVRTNAFLPATGRKPATAALDLDAAGVKTADRGAVLVDE